MAQKVVLKVLTMTDEKTKQKAIEAAADIYGVDSIAADLKEQKLTVIGQMDTVAVVKKLKKVGKERWLMVWWSGKETEEEGGEEDPELHTYFRRNEIRKTVNFIYNRVGSAVNIGEQGFLTILNVVTSMLWGGTVQGEERESIGAEFRSLISGMTEILGLPNVSDFFPGLARFDLQGHVKRMDVIAKKLDAVFDKVIERRLRSGEDGGHDFLQFLLKYKEEGDHSIIELRKKKITEFLTELKRQSTERGRSG